MNDYKYIFVIIDTVNWNKLPVPPSRQKYVDAIRDGLLSSGVIADNSQYQNEVGFYTFEPGSPQAAILGASKFPTVAIGYMSKGELFIVQQMTGDQISVQNVSNVCRSINQNLIPVTEGREKGWRWGLNKLASWGLKMGDAEKFLLGFPVGGAPGIDVSELLKSLFKDAKSLIAIAVIIYLSTQNDG